MKTSLFFLISLSFFSANSFAGPSQAANRNYQFCDDIAKVDKFLNRSRESVQRIKDEGLNIERVVISKDRKEIYLVSGETLLRVFPVAFGSNPVGHKQFDGDGKTPEGIYSIDYKNPQSAYTKSLHISYPNKRDLEYAKAQGKSPGGDIMIHGLPTDERKRQMIEFIHPMNWTQGCVAVSNPQIEEIYSLVQEDTLVEICKMTVADNDDSKTEESGKTTTISIPAKSN